MEIETKNAKITSTMLGFEDHGIMTLFLNLKYGQSSAQGAGGYCLDAPLKVKGVFKRRIGTALGMDLIMSILKVVEVNTWEDLPGKTIRVKATHNKVHAIGNLLSDDWIDFDEFFRTANNQEVR